MSQTTEHAPLAHQDAIGQLHTNHSCSHSRRVGCSRAIGYLHRSIWPDRQTAGGSLCGIALSTICLWCARYWLGSTEALRNARENSAHTKGAGTNIGLFRIVSVTSARSAT